MMQESTMTWFEKVETSKILKWSTFIMAFLVVLLPFFTPITIN